MHGLNTIKRLNEQADLRRLIDADTAEDIAVAHARLQRENKNALAALESE